MCLTITNPKKNFIERILNIDSYKPLYKIANKDLTFYKVVKMIGIGYFTPFYSTPIQLNIPYKNNLPIDIIESSSLCYDITSGVFHLCETYKSAEILKNKQYSLHGQCYKVLKAIVPKGTKYYEGFFLFFGDSYPSIGTECVIYKEINEE